MDTPAVGEGGAFVSLGSCKRPCRMAALRQSFLFAPPSSPMGSDIPGWTLLVTATSLAPRPTAELHAPWSAWLLDAQPAAWPALLCLPAMYSWQYKRVYKEKCVTKSA